MTELELLKSKIDNYDIVSFDIFDTLLLRNVEKPIDIFKILEKEVKDKYYIENFSQIRIEAETKSRTEANSYETNFNEIYNMIDINPLIKEKIKTMELELEEKFLVANPFMKEVYKYAVSQGKKVICISDMYLSSKTIEKFLKLNGYDDVKVYVSCEYQKHKGNMTLYAEVQKIEKLDKNKWIHIGDNYYSDYLQSKNYGIGSYHYKKVSERSNTICKDSSIASSIVHATSNNYAYNGLDIPYWKKFGILYAAPLYFAFANWVYNNNITSDNVYFFARDGYIVKKIFDIIKERNKSDIYSSYFYTSRRATQLPLLIYKDKTEAVDTLCGINFQLGDKQHVKNIFECFDLDANNYDGTISQFGFNGPEDYITMENHICYKQLISNVYDDFKEKMKEQTNLIEKYLVQEKVYDFKRINIVDIGWRGSIQYALSNIYKNEIFGYYFCTGAFVYNSILYNTRGFLLNYNNPNSIANIIISNLMLFEFLFSAPEGSVIKYEEKNGKIIPILEESKEYTEEIKTIQDSSLKIIKKYLEYYDYVNDLTSEESVENYVEFINKRCYDDVFMFSKLFTNVGYSGSKISFINSFKKEDIESNVVNFVESRTINSMWSDTFIIEGVDNEKDFKEYMNYINSLYKNKYKTSFIKKTILYRGLRYIKRKVMN